MKAAFFFLTVLFTAHTSFAELRSIVVEVVAHRGGAPTVNIYSPHESDQRTNASVAEAASVLHTTKNPFDTVLVFVLAEELFTSMDDLLTVMDGARGNSDVILCYLRVGKFSEGDKQLLAEFKIPAYTKAAKP